MNNHFKVQSVMTDMENISDDVELIIQKFKFKIAKRYYYKIIFKHEDHRSSILLNKEQLEQLSKNLNDYVSSQRHLKRTNSKGSVLKALL